MDWTERMNAAIAYLEANLEGEIVPERLAQIAGCSAYNFQRVFSYVAELPLSQYLRERRLTLAAFDVVRTQERLIDIALRYGYDSQDAFTRAFRQYHGMAPSTARKEAVALNSRPRIVFHKAEGEDGNMEHRMEAWPSFTVAGYKVPMRTDAAFDEVPKLWTAVYQDGRIQTIFGLFQQADYRPAGIVGVAAVGQKSDAEMMDYYLGVTTHVDRPGVAHVQAPEGMEELTVPAATWVIMPTQGDPYEVVQPAYKQFYAKWLPTSGYTLADLPVIECYFPDNRQEVWFAVEKE